jgi:AcrR family transcriptional regulator
MTTDNIGWDPLRVELLWGLKEPPRRGPKPSLTVEQIAAAGIEIADQEGLDALSMQRLADELGVGTMTLYTYIPDKNALLEVMLNLAYTEALPHSLNVGWRQHLEEGALGAMSAYQRHPWALRVFVAGPPTGPSQIKFLEDALQALSETGLEDWEKLDIVMSITSYVRGAAHISVGITEYISRSGLSQEQMGIEYAKAYTRILDPEQFPISARLLTGSPENPPPPEANDYGFRYGLDRLLDGIGRRIESAASEAR